MANFRIALLLACMSGVSHGQTGQPSIKQQAERSTCANIVALTGNVDIDCSSLTPEQQKIFKEIPVLLRRILAKQVDVTALKTEMDEILKTVQTNASSTVSKQQYCEAGSLCNQDSQVNAPQTVKNYGSIQPPPQIVWQPITDTALFPKFRHTPNPALSGAAIKLLGGFYDPAFVVTCSTSCRLATGGVLGQVTDRHLDSRTILITFSIPRQMDTGYVFRIFISSEDENVKVVNVQTYAAPPL